MKDYLANIADSGYEDWKRANPEKSFSDFVFDVANFPKSGALFDLAKLDSINRERISGYSKELFFEKVRAWADAQDEALSESISKHPELAFRAANIERLSEKDPKRFAKLSDVAAQLLPFFPERFEAAKKTAPAFPENVPSELRDRILAAYGDRYDAGLEKDAWFDDLKAFGKEHGFAATGEEFKSG